MTRTPTRASLAELAATARTLGRVALPVALAEALEARRVFRARGLRRTSLRLSRQAWLSRVHLLPPDLDLTGGLVLDVGANEGSFSAAILELAPAATIVAVEPAPGPRARLEARFGERITIVPKAMAARSGTATLHITAHDHNSSLRAPRAELVSTYHDAGWAVREDIEVPTTSLDDLVGDRAVSVLKLDVQGGELAVLEGGRGALSRTSAVLMEVTFFSHYEGDATFGPLHDEMTRLGFVLTAMSEPGRTADGRSTWTDACYTRGDRG